MKKSNILFVFLAIVVSSISVIAHATNYKSALKQQSFLILQNIEALANNEGGEGGGTTCTATTECYRGSVSCTGKKCSRFSGSAFESGWVECDGVKTTC